MNSDTSRSIKETIKNGSYKLSMTLGDGGWQALYPHINGWKTYELLDLYEGEVDTIKAKNDETAIKAFDSLYHLESFPYEIREKIVEYRKVKSEIKEEY